MKMCLLKLEKNKKVRLEAAAVIDLSEKMRKVFCWADWVTPMTHSSTPARWVIHAGMLFFRNLNAEEVRLRGDHALSKLIRANVIKTGLDSFQKLKILNTRKIFEKCDL